MGGTGGDYMQGLMDEMAVYDDPPSGAEIRKHFLLGRRDVAGLVKFQARSSNDPDFIGVPFTGAVGTQGSYYPLPGALVVGPGAYFQYAAYFEGGVDATPALQSVTIGYDAFTKETSDLDADEFGDGTFVDGTVQWYGDEMGPRSLSLLGPPNVRPTDYPSLVGLWHLDEPVWGDVVDEVGSGSGSAEGNAFPSALAKVGTYCGFFDGTSGRVSLGSQAVGQSPFTVTLWMRSTQTTRRSLLSSYVPSGAFIALELNSDGAGQKAGHAAFVLYDGVSGLVAVASQRGNLNDGRWHNLIGVRDYNQIFIYVDGDLAGTTYIGDGYGDVNGGSPKLAFDSRFGYYSGTLDEVAIFGQALSRREIGTLSGAGAQTKTTGVFVGPTIDATDATIWDVLSWNIHSMYANALSADADGVVALWHLDETTGGTAYDAGTNGYDGAVAALQGSAGRFDRCVEFSDATNRIVVADDPGGALEPEQFSVECWVNVTDPANIALIDKRDIDSGYALAVGSDARPYFWVGDGVSGVSCAGSLGLRAAEWAHVAGTYDGLRLRLYLNGILAGEAPLDAADASLDAGDLKMGESYLGTQNLGGKIDEVALHNRALTPSEIEDHYRAGVVTVKFQARSWDPPPQGDYVGPGPSNNTYFTDWFDQDLQADIEIGQYLQYRAVLATEDHRHPPVVQGVHVDYSSYPMDNPTVYPVDSRAFPFLGKVVSFNHSRTMEAGTEIKYQLSGGIGGTNQWYFWDTYVTPSRWTNVTAYGGGYPAASTLAQVNNNIGSFYEQIYPAAGGLLRFKAFLHSQGDRPLELDWVEVTASKGRIVVTSPNGPERGEKAWLIGVPYQVTWSHAGNVAGTVGIRYSLNGGTNWTQIASGVNAAAMTYPWLTPETESGNCIVAIDHEQDATIYDRSDAPFQLVKRYLVVKPNGGEKWYIGETNYIVWGAAQGLGSVSLDFSGTGGWGAPVNIDNFVPTVGGVMTNRYKWEIPIDDPKLPSTNARVRVQTFGGQFTDTSDEDFTMAGAAFTAPLVGEGVNQGSTFDVTWNAAAMGSNVTMEVQLEPDGPWYLVSDSVTNSPGANTFGWTVTNPPSETARLRVTSQADPRARGISGTFTIAALVVLSPKGDQNAALAEKWLQGSTQTVAWLSAGMSDHVNLLVSTNSGSSWTPIPGAQNYVNSNIAGFTNTFPWVVPRTPSPKARIRVEDAARPVELFDTSDFDFHIAGVSVLFPNGPVSQEWPVQQVDVVLWKQNRVGNDGFVEFSYDGGLTYTNIVAPGVTLALSDEESPGYVPHTPTVRGLVRITPVDPSPFTNVFDVSDSYFAVAGVKVVEPSLVGVLNENQEYTIGETNPVSFVAAATHAPGLVADIWYAGDGVSFPTNDPSQAIKLDEIFSESYPGLHTYNWVVGRTRDPSITARILVQAGQYSSISETFTVRGIKFVAPLAGEIVAPGAKPVGWLVAGLADDTSGDIWASTEGVTGDFTNKVNQFPVTITDQGTVWNIPAEIDPTTNAILKIVVTNSPSVAEDLGYTAYSEPFTLQGVKMVDPQAVAWELGGTYTIRWRAAAAGESAYLYYSSDGGTNYDSLAIAEAIASTDGVNTYDWTVEMFRTPSANARIKVVTFGGLEAVSAPFEMRGIKLTRPTGRDIYATTDATNMVRWVVVGDPGPYALSYVKEGAPEQAFTNVAGVTEVNWLIEPAAVSTNIFIIIRGATYANTSEVFKIVTQPIVEIVSPAPNAYWHVGNTNIIEWSRGGQMLNDFSVYFSLAPYAASNEITGTVTFDTDRNAFSIPWIVPDQLTQAKIIVQHNSLASVRDESAPFNMIGSFQVWSPDGGEILYARRPTPVVWRTKGSVAFVDVYYSFTPPYRANSWTKVNSTPIENNYKVNLTWEQTTWPWTVADVRSSLVKFRVQEAAYTNKFDSGVDGPFDDSDAGFRVRYYTVYWDVFDRVTSNRLDNVAVVDSSGWSAAGLSAIAPSTISHDYPWGRFNTEFYREYFDDGVVLYWTSENQALGSPPVWTQQVAMKRSEIEPDYHVMANFAYETSNKTFTIHSWIERSGVVLDKPTESKITIYDEAGSQIEELVNGAPQSNGVFWTVWDASALSTRNVYWAKVGVKFSGFYYSSALTFSLRVPLTDEFQDIITGQTSNILAGVDASISGVSSNLSDFRTEMRTNLNTLAETSSNILGEVSGLGGVSNAMVDVYDAVTNLENMVTTIDQNTRAQTSRILTRPTTLLFGSTNTFLYKSTPGYGDDAVTITVSNAAAGPIPLPGGDKMAEVINGIYERALRADWGYGEYVVTCADPLGAASDSLVVNVVSEITGGEAQAIGNISNTLTQMQLDLAQMTVMLDDVTNSTAMIGDLNTQLDNVEFFVTNRLDAGISEVTNLLSALSDLDTLRDQIREITNSLGTIMSITNIGDDVSGLTDILGDVTNALQGMYWPDVVLIREAVFDLTNQVAGLEGLTELSGEIAGLSNAVARIGDLTNVTAQLDLLTNKLSAVDFVQMQSDFVAFRDNMIVVTNALGPMDWQDIMDMSAIMVGMSNEFYKVDWTQMGTVSSNTAAILAAMGQMNWDDVLALSNQFAQVDWNVLGGVSSNMVTITNALGQMNWGDILFLTNQFGQVDWTALGQLSDDVVSITNQLGLMNWNDVLVLTNQFGQVNWPALAQMSTDVISITNALGQMDWNDVLWLTNQFAQVEWTALSGISSNMATITNALGQMDWNDILALSTAMTQMSNAFAGVAWDDLGSISSNTTDIVDALGLMNWNDILALSNQFAQVEWTALSGISSNMTVITNALGEMQWSDVQLIADNVDVITNELSKVDWATMTSVGADVGVIRTATAGIDWSQIGTLDLAVNNIELAVRGLTGADFGQLNTSLTAIETQLGGVADAATANTLLARVDSIVGQVGSAAADAANAAKRAQSAKTEASSAAGAVQSLKDEIARGNLEGSLRILEEIRRALGRTEATLGEIPGAIEAATMDEDIRRMARLMNEFAASRGYEWLVTLDEPPGAGEGGLDQETLTGFNRRMQEMAGTMLHLRKLVDQQVNAPVITEMLLPGSTE